ncbi:MAG: GAF domain-containing protein [Chloroflexi bacterium]|nr:GAF domain-containing protein [Chloroflexota bacterium]
MKKLFHRFTENLSPQARNGWFITALITLAHFAAVPYYLYLSGTAGIVQLNLLAYITLALGVTFGVGILLIQRDRSTAGMCLVLGVLAFSYPPISAFLVSGLGMVLGIALAIVGPLSAFQSLPQKPARLMAALTLTSGISTVLLDLFGSDTRPPLPGVFIQVLAASVVGMILALVVGEFRKRSMRLTLKLLTPTLIFITLLVAIVISYNVFVSVRQYEEAEVARLANMEAVFQSRLKAREDMAVALAAEVANNPEVQAAFAAGDRERLIELTLPGYQMIDTRFDIPQYQFHLPPAVSFLRLHNLEQYGDDLSAFRFTVLKANTEQKVVSGLEIGRGGLGIRGVVPVTYQGRHVGTVEFGPNVDLTLLQELKNEFGYDMQILLERSAAEIATFEGVVGENEGPINETLLQASTLGTPFFAPASNYRQALAGVPGVEHVNIEDHEYAVYSAPLYDFSGRIIGVVDIISDHTLLVQQQTAQILVSLVVFALTLLIIGVGFSYFASRTLRPIGELTAVADAVTHGELDQRAGIHGNDEIGVLATAFNTMTSQLQSTLQRLEQRVADRTRNLELAAQVGRAVSQVRALDIMLKDACELILKEFNLYYVQVYLADPGGSTLKLEAGTGSVGAQLLERGHSLPLTINSINGRAAVEKRSVVISDTAQSADFLANPLLPETRSEMAIPLIVADKVMGVLDMQSAIPGALTDELLPAFEALAGQLAVAILNANLLAETEQARSQVEKQARRLVRQGWSEYLDAIHKPERLGFVFDHNRVAPLTETDVPPLSEHGNTISAPIAVTGEPLGLLSVELTDDTHAEQTQELVGMVARQVAQQIENLRLLESAERYRHEAERAARLQTLEGWRKYIETRSADTVAYLYDANEVRPAGAVAQEMDAFTLPLKAREEKIGKLAVEGLNPEDRDAVELLDAVADRLSAHIENLRLFEETRQGQFELDKRARQLAAVAEISNLSSKELDVQKMVESVVRLTQRKFGLYHAHIFLYNEKTDELQIAACGWKEGDEHEGTHGSRSIPLSQEQSLVARAARTRQAVVANNVFLEPGWLPNPLLPDTASELAVPLVIGDRVLGVLDVQSDRLNAFTEEDANIQTTLASQVATALQNARSFAQAQKQAEREAMLNVINQKIQSATSVEAVLQIAARELGHALGAPMTVAQLSMKDRAS